MSSESYIEKMVVYYGKAKYGAEAIKQTMFAFYGVAGWPDHEFLAPTADRPPLFLEFKTPEGKLKPVQREKIRWLQVHGYPVYCCRSIPTGKLYIDHWMGKR